jgi:hypothetical protein
MRILAFWRGAGMGILDGLTFAPGGRPMIALAYTTVSLATYRKLRQ